MIRAARTLEALHLQGKVHGSLCPDAWQISGDDAAQPGALVRPPHRAEFSSPERLRTHRPSPADDTWALALTLYVALTLYHPFEDADETEVPVRIRTGPVPPLVAFGLHDEGLQFILDRALEREVLQRTIAVEPLRRALDQWLAEDAPLPPLDGLEDLLSLGADLPGFRPSLPVSLGVPPLPRPAGAAGASGAP